MYGRRPRCKRNLTLSEGSDRGPSVAAVVASQQADAGIVPVEYRAAVRGLPPRRVAEPCALALGEETCTVLGVLVITGIHFALLKTSGHLGPVDGQCPSRITLRKSQP